MEQQPIHVFAKWRVQDGKLDTVLALLNQAAIQSRQEEGNLFYRLHQSTTDANTIVLFEGYANEEALAAHRSSEHFQTVVVGQIVPLLAEREVTVTTELI
ncbi:putative quinol monooxygenase [Mucilaginibacter pedocola]|uniref:Antibiotic biosynthesis monooxygenase n=1 Tax=Mucilaginibacter pedocola TaxID=1792845 RepID=A0A1S9PHX0_9SPHI|nr:putative quinol monooxygenase [Mucilaginibacter pedocola]OOQ60529.1 antibiotic biosynthesis monooxygenase [Mucilaginibacter pedocola]